MNERDTYYIHASVIGIIAILLFLACSIRANLERIAYVKEICHVAINLAHDKRDSAEVFRNPLCDKK